MPLNALALFLKVLVQSWMVHKQVSSISFNCGNRLSRGEASIAELRGNPGVTPYRPAIRELNASQVMPSAWIPRLGCPGNASMGLGAELPILILFR